MTKNKKTNTFYSQVYSKLDVSGQMSDVPRKGQSLIEIVVAIALAGVLLGGAVAMIVAFTRSNKKVQEVQTAIDLGNQLTDSVRVLANSDWNAFYQLNKTPSNHYTASTSPPSSLKQELWASSTLTGGETIPIRGITYARWFYVENVYRLDSNDSIVPAGTPLSTLDSSTQFIVIQVQWNNDPNSIMNFSQYLTRTRRNEVFQQTDWSGGPNQETFPNENANNRFATSTVDINGISTIDYSSSSGSLYLIGGVPGNASVTSSVFDTQSSSSLNSILWQGANPNPVKTFVKFQIASSTSPSGPWNNFVGPGNSQSLYYPITNQATAGTSYVIDRQNFNGTKYFRYKLYIDVDAGGTSPRIDDVIINYSP
ncbi:MAG: prepilin-type N-terminal cleavage/methylation domain-containing protein [bacterium]|nr:prepilin-type N-terminal cleavage/methylation domain-containing protein [bacterium]